MNFVCKPLSNQRYFKERHPKEKCNFPEKTMFETFHFPHVDVLPSGENIICQTIAELLKDDKDKDAKRAATQAQF